MAAIILVSILAISYGQKDQPVTTQTTADILIANVDSIGLERSSGVRLFVGDSLWEYINGGAELYHKYKFVDVATADYFLDSIELVVDIYRFDSPVHSYGLYSMLRPESPQTVSMGIDGFSSPSNLVFVKGSHVVMVTAYDAGEKVTNAITNTAEYFNSTVAGIVSRPRWFTAFPQVDIVPASDQIFAESFMGQAFLTDVYCQKHDRDGDTLLLFATEDESGAKFISWQEQIGSDGREIKDLPFDEGLSVRFTHSYYGEIVTGLSGGRLVGVVGFSDKHAEFVADWLKALALPTH